MNKLPVLKTIRFAYAFAFGDIGTIIGLVWLPTLLIAILQFLPYALGTQSATDGKAAAGAAGLANLAFLSFALILYAVNAVSVTRQALGLRKGGASFHFAVGAPEWRVLGANLLCAFILGALVLTYWSGFALTSSYLRTGGEPAALGLLLYAVAGVCLLLFAGLRLVFLVIPLVVAEEKVNLRRAWNLTRGNFWRIFAVMLAVVLPLLVVQFGATIAIAGPQFVAPLPDKPEAMAAAINARSLLLDKHMPMLIGLFLLLAPFNFGLTLGAEAAAYQALVPGRARRD